MMATPRAAAVKVVAVYWALLVFGMVAYSAIRLDALAVLAPVWVGTVGGTMLGQLLAVKRYRPWLAGLIVLAIACFILPHVPDEIGGKRLWLAFLPASVCGYWSLGDRTSLAAFWFPAVIWMLSILDGVSADSVPGGNGLILFGGLAVLFIVFLRVREERRAALWRTVSPEPLATEAPQRVVRERASAQAARALWGALVTSLGFAVTLYIAPQLWSHEAHEGTHVTVAGGDAQQIGLPCCPSVEEDAPTQHRVKEYLDIGRARTEHHLSKPGVDCRVCTGEGDIALGEGGTAGGIVLPDIIGRDDFVVTGEATTAPYATGGTGTYHYDYTAGTNGNAHVTSYEPPGGSPVVAPPSESAPIPTPPSNEPSLTGTGPSGASVTTLPTPQQPAPPQVTPPYQMQEPPPSQAPPATSPKVDNRPQESIAPRPHLSSNHSMAHASDHHQVPVRSDDESGPHLMHWVALLALAVFMTKLVSLALRPLRRMVVLRHLRRPFWDETVDQRVSNAWQLVLVGLRDAGWRADGAESPRELARRAKVDGVEQCATILDRARHGIQIDREDLASMVSSADAAYRSARTSLGVVPRAISWLRWPLV